MAIRSLQEKMVHELGDIYDAEHQFLNAQQEMHKKASDSTVKQMIETHIRQTEQQIQNLEQAFQSMGQKPQRVKCQGAAGIVAEGQKIMQETSGNPQICDLAIAGSAAKVEHYEIATYRGLITAAQQMGQQDLVRLLQQNLQQEEQTAQKIEQSTPTLLKNAMQQQQGMGASASSQMGAR